MKKKSKESRVCADFSTGLNAALKAYHYPLPCSKVAKLAWAVEYTDCTSAEGYDSPNKCRGYDTKQYDSKVSVMLELWEMHSTPLLPSLPSPLWPGEVAPDRVLFIGQIELNRVLMLN